jgi:protein involved in polysaccharide export with SLBB domain
VEDFALNVRNARVPLVLLSILLLWTGRPGAQQPPVAMPATIPAWSAPPAAPVSIEPLRQNPQTVPAPPASNGTAEPARAQKPPEEERSGAETYFARPAVPVGEAVGGSGQLEQVRPKLDASAEEAFYRLLAEGDALAPYERGSLYRKLDPGRRQQYLDLLSPEERRILLKSLGEEERWYAEELVGADVDRNLTQFGYGFFAVGAAGFPAEGLAPVGPDYIIGPGDTVRIDLWGSLEGSHELLVNRQGEIVIPRVGNVQLWGKTFAEAKETVRRQIARYYTNFELNVSMGPLRSIQVYLVGEVKAPGTYTVSSLATVLNALAAAGGPAKTGSLRGIQLVRQGRVVTTIDFYDFFLNGDRTSDLRMQSGDTVHVPVAGPLVGVAGEVRRPAIYELKENETLGDLLKLAGGVNPTAFLKKVQVERVEAHRQTIALDLDLSGEPKEGGGLAFRLQDRDLVKVGSISPVRASYVKLKGYVAHPGTYQLSEGMRLADLLTPYENLLPDSFLGLAEAVRLRPPAWRPEKITVDLQKALAGDPQQNLALVDFDEVTIFSRAQMEEIPEVQVVGAVQKPGSYRYYEQMTVRDLVTAAGNLRRGAYLGEAELTRLVSAGAETRTERLTLDLGRAMAGETQHNLPLRPDDRLQVRGIPDFAERLQVRIEGEVLFPGTYTLAPGERLSSLLERAGGFSAKAYPRGAIFSRDSLREVQRQRLEKLISEQEQEVFRVSADIARGALSEEERKGAETVLESRRQLLAKLRQAPVTGRMVVHLRPASELRGTSDDIELMDGDTLRVPINPQSVTVLGQVYNPISLTHRPGKTVAWYLDQVGGVTKEANTVGMFVVRADGTVLSHQQGGSGVRWDGDRNRWVFGGFNNTALDPGDTLLVPEQVRRVDVMREVKDLTTILYQMALGAAAVASF